VRSGSAEFHPRTLLIPAAGRQSRAPGFPLPRRCGKFTGPRQEAPFAQSGPAVATPKETEQEIAREQPACANASNPPDVLYCLG